MPFPGGRTGGSLLRYSGWDGGHGAALPEAIHWGVRAQRDWKTEPSDLSGQTVIVTGAGRGLGRAFALALAGAGAHVVVTSRSEPELRAVVSAIEQAGGMATAIVADVTQRAAVEALVGQVEQHVGAIDLVVNNAGVARALGRVAEVDPDEWWRELRSTCAARTWLCARCCRICSAAGTAGSSTWPVWPD